MLEGRAAAVAATLPDGSVLVAGGRDMNQKSLASSEMFLPAEDRWAAVRPMHKARAGAAAIALSNGCVLVAGGQAHLGPMDSTEVYDVTCDTWTKARSMLAGRACFAMAPVFKDRMLATGGLSKLGFCCFGQPRACDICEVRHQTSPSSCFHA